MPSGAEFSWIKRSLAPHCAGKPLILRNTLVPWFHMLYLSIPLYSKVDDPKSCSLNFMHFMLAAAVVWVRLEKSKITKT
jgi:hypothetical protein